MYVISKPSSKHLKYFDLHAKGRKFKLVIDYILESDPMILCSEQFPSSNAKWVRRRVCFDLKKNFFFFETHEQNFGSNYIKQKYVSKTKSLRTHLQ